MICPQCNITDNAFDAVYFIVIIEKLFPTILPRNFDKLKVFFD